MADEGTPLAARLLGVGARGAGAVGRVTGLDRAVETAAEEAIVAAVESEAVERALARVLEGPLVEDAVRGALGSEAVKDAMLEALDSELVDEVWRRVLASEEAQQLVERIAAAPEVRAAIASQGVGLLGDIGRQVAKLARDLDGVLEHALRRILFRRRRAVPTDRAGVVSRGAALLIDAVIVNLFFTALAGATTLLVTFFGGNAESVPRGALAAGSFAWLVVVGTYLAGFWALAGQTPGMRFLGIRLDQRRLSLGRAIRRVGGLALCFLSFGIGFLGIVFGARRRDWADRLGRTEVIYDERRPAPAPWSTLTAPVPSPAPAFAEPAPTAAGEQSRTAEVRRPVDPPRPEPPSGSAGTAAPAA